MKPFSERIGVRPSKTIIQKNSMDKDLKTGLTNALFSYYWKPILQEIYISAQDPVALGLIDQVWQGFLKKGLDELPYESHVFYEYIKSFYRNANWNEIYDFLEFVPRHFGDEQIDFSNHNKNFYEYCNLVLQKELSAYRFINGFLTPITSEQEILSIEMALEMKDKFASVAVHIDTALRMLSDKENPDYRNSVKESISAVESYCSIMVREPKATLGKALAKIEVKNDIHPSLKEAFNKLYGYTSDEEGIRHKLLDAPNVKQEDAVFMLVTCSAFINYLKQKEI